MEWLRKEDRDIINEEQAPLLELHKELVEELTETARAFIKPGPDGRPLFPDFWTSCWAERMKDVLTKLGQDLTDAERRGAEEIGVRWHGPVGNIKKENGNPYVQVAQFGVLFS